MTSRVEKYSQSSEQEKESSRVQKNKNLYDDLNNKIGFEELSNFNTQTKIDLTNLRNSPHNREGYQQIKEYQDLLPNVPKETVVKEEPVPEIQEPKVFDINSILEEAKKNRAESEEVLEEKRKLKNEEYNVLSDLNKKYLTNKEKSLSDEEKVELKELIDTITSKTLSKELLEAEASMDEGEPKDLMSDLMATHVDSNLEEGIAKEILKEENIKTEIDDDRSKEGFTEGKLVNSFYTKSMDLSEQDFEIKNEIEEETHQKRKVLIVIIIIILLLLIIGVGVVVLHNMGMI